MIAGYFLAAFFTILLPLFIYVIYNAQKVTRNQFFYISKEIKIIEPFVDLAGDVIESYKKRHKHENYKEAKYVCGMFGLEREPWDEFDELFEISYNNYKEGIKNVNR